MRSEANDSLLEFVLDVDGRRKQIFMFVYYATTNATSATTMLLLKLLPQLI